MGELPLDSAGFRGALLLEAGVYEIHGILSMSHSGVVLRGVGDGGDSSQNTILKGIGNEPNQRDILQMGGGSANNWSGMVAGTQTDIVSPLVRVGDGRFEVEDASLYAVGDNVVVYHPCTQAWIDAVDGGGTASEPAWSPNTLPLVFNRRIAAIEGNWIEVDVPIYNHLDRSLAQSYLYKYNRAGLVTHVGLEDLRIDIQTQGGEDENHAWNAVRLIQVEDAWVRGCTFLHFGLSGVITRTATRVTVDSCYALDPVAKVTRARMYNFNVTRASSQVLFKDCYASNGRHHYVSNGVSLVSGCVFLNCTSDAAYTSSEGHRRWSMGLLFDNLKEINVRRARLRLLGLYNRGDYGTAHGWSSAHSVAWNCDMGIGTLVVQKPPTAQNYAIGTKGFATGAGPFNQPTGYIEKGDQGALEPASLYEAQLLARQAGKTEKVVTSTISQTPYPEISLFPNPSSTTILVKGTATLPEFNWTYEVFDSLGRQLKNRRLPASNAIDLSLLDPGMYFIRLFTPTRSLIRKVVKTP